MSLKDAVGALRSLKAELEASRSSKKELEAAYRGVLEELRVAKEAQQQREQGGESQDSNNAGHDDNEAFEGQGGSSSPVVEEEEKLAAALKEEARNLRGELAAFKALTEEKAASSKRELQEAISAKDEAIEASESTQAAAEAAESKLVQEQARAGAAEKELEEATKDRAFLRARLEEMSKELESARDAIAAEESSRSREEGEDAAELESELKSIREAVGMQPSPPEAVDTSAAVERAHHLEEELASAAKENLEMRELMEVLKREKEKIEQQLAQQSEAATERETEMESLRLRLVEEEEARKEAQREAAQDKASCEVSASALAAAQEDSRKEVTLLNEKLADTTRVLEEAQLLLVSERAKKDEEASAAASEAEAQAAKAAEKVEAAETMLEREKLTGAEALSRITELETALQESEAGRSRLVAAAATEKETRDAERDAAAATAATKIAAELAAKESAEGDMREAQARASTAEATVVRLESMVSMLQKSLSEAEKVANMSKEAEKAAEKARAEAHCTKQGVEETLLIANKELQRLKIKNDETLSESEGLREECGRLTATVEALRATAAAAAVASNDGNNDETTSAMQHSMGVEDEEKGEKAESPSAQEAREEILRLRETIQEMERARGEVLAADGRASRDNQEEEEQEDRDAEKRREAEQALEERDRLRAELGEEKHKAATRVAGLEMQLADKEREAADTQRRLYLRQSELEAELEDLNAQHDALRVEMARMDASMQDAADASLHPSPSSLNGKVGGGPSRVGIAVAGKAPGRDPAAMGAEVGEAVGGIFRGKLWSGWGGRGGGGNSDVSAAEGGVREMGSASSLSKSKTKGVEGGRVAGVVGGASGEADQESLSRVRQNMITRLQEAKTQSVSRNGQKGSGRVDGSAPAETKVSVGGVPRADAGKGENREGMGSTVGGASGREGSAAELTEDEWVEETVEHPAPDYGLDSPVIRYLLQQWSSEPEKLRYLSLWLRCVIERRKVPDAFPSGLQLVGLAPEIKDGFLTLVIPMIRFAGGIPVLVHSRRSPPDESVSTGDGDTNRETGLWDLRVKVDLPDKNIPGGGPDSRSSAGEREC